MSATDDAGRPLELDMVDPERAAQILTEAAGHPYDYSRTALGAYLRTGARALRDVDRLRDTNAALLHLLTSLHDSADVDCLGGGWACDYDDPADRCIVCKVGDYLSRVANETGADDA